MTYCCSCSRPAMSKLELSEKYKMLADKLRSRIMFDNNVYLRAKCHKQLYVRIRLLHRVKQYTTKQTTVLRHILPKTVADSETLRRYCRQREDVFN